MAKAPKVKRTSSAASPQRPRIAIAIMAAGKGTRLKSKHPKVLHEVGGKPILAYVIATAATYLSIVYSVVVGVAPISVLVALLSLPLAYKACRIVMRECENTWKLVPALGLNVIMILATILLLGVGFLIAIIV